MKILQISNRVPWPLNDGGAIATYNLTRAFSELGHDVTLYCLDAIKHNTPIAKAEFELKKYAKLLVIPINTDLKISDALQSLLKNESYNVSRFYNGEFNRRIKEILQKEKFDVVHLEGTFTGPCLNVVKNNFDGLISIRMHNVEHEIWNRLARNESNPLKSGYLRILAKQLKKYESSLVKKVQSIVSITDNDGAIFRNYNPDAKVFTSSTGVDLDQWKFSQTEGIYNWYHLGSMEWHANREAVEWFVNKIHPLLASESSEYKLHLGGKGIANLNLEETSSLRITPEVPDAFSFVQNKDICIVPLKSGSGIRIKILEAMAAGKLVVSTTVGAQGIEYENEKNILIADTPEEFLNAFRKLKEHKISFTELTKNANDLIHSRYSHMARAKQLLDHYQSMLKV